MIVAGCVPQGDQKSSAWDGLSVIGVQQIDRVVEVVEEALRGSTVHLFRNTKKDRPGLDLPKVRRNRWIEIVPINTGCLNQCTYCKTKHARGVLNSWPVDEICGRVDQVCGPWAVMGCGQWAAGCRMWNTGYGMICLFGIWDVGCGRVQCRICDEICDMVCVMGWEIGDLGRALGDVYCGCLGMGWSLRSTTHQN